MTQSSAPRCGKCEAKNAAKNACGPSSCIGFALLALWASNGKSKDRLRSQYLGGASHTSFVFQLTVEPITTACLHYLISD
jgi:hypothetical protein